MGAHLGEEAADYEKFGWTPVIWVEAQPNLVQTLNSKLESSKHTVIEATIWEENGAPLKLNIASNSQSTSLLNFGTHTDTYPDVTFVTEIEVITKRLDSIIKPNKMPNFINLDIQGVELPAIKSLGKLLLSIDYIYTEVNKKEVYEGCTLVTDLDEYLLVNGFKRASTRWYLNEGWGDALYIRNSRITTKSPIQILCSFLLWAKFYIRQHASKVIWGLRQRFIEAETS